MQVKAIFKCVADDDAFLTDEVKAIIEDGTESKCIEATIIDENYSENDYEGTTYVVRATIDTDDVQALENALKNAPEFDKILEKED